MKKLALLLVAGLLAACGSGGSSGTTASGTPTTGKDTGTVTVNIVEPKQTGKFYNVSSAAVNAAWRRVVVTNPALNDGARIFKQYYDFPKANQPTLTFSLPYASGYVFEFLEYNTTSTFKTYSTPSSTPTGGTLISDNLTYPTSNILAYAKATNVNIGSGATTINLVPKGVPSPILKFPVTRTVFNGYSGVPGRTESASFQVQASFTNLSTPTMFNANRWNLTVRKKEVATSTITTYFANSVSGSTVSVSSPLVWANNELQLRGLGTFYLNDSILLPNESYTKFSKAGNSSFIPVVIRIKDVPL